MNNPFVTIGIPTYNRVRQLAVLIDSILLQISDQFAGKIEILVSDNHSTEPVRELVFDYIRRYPNLFTYKNNNVNLGFSLNVDRVMSNAKGEYVLLMGDDDALESDALTTLWDILRAHPAAGVVILGVTPYDSDLETPLRVRENQAVGQKGILYEPGLDFVRRNHVFAPALISGCVFKREAWLQAHPSDFYNTISIHRCCAMRILMTHDIYVSHIATIKYRTNGVGAEDWSKDPIWPFAFDLGDLFCCHLLKPVYPADLYHYLHTQAMRSIIYFIMRQKVTSGQLNESLLRNKLYELANQREPLTWLALLILRLPKWGVYIPFKVIMWFRGGK